MNQLGKEENILELLRGQIKRLYRCIKTCGCEGLIQLVDCLVFGEFLRDQLVLILAHTFLLHADFLDVLVKLQLVTELSELSLSIEVIFAKIYLVNLVKDAREFGHK